MSNKITAAIFSFDKNITDKILSNLREIDCVEEIIIVSTDEINSNSNTIKSTQLFSGETIRDVINKTSTKYLMLIDGNRIIELSRKAVKKFISEAEITNSGWVYADYNEKNGIKILSHPLIDYQIGSIRDDFDFGQCYLANAELAKINLPDLYSTKSKLLYSGIYDLRLTISRKSTLSRITEPLYSVQTEESSGSEKIFEYVNPKNRQIQIEMEKVATHHLKEINAFINPADKKIVNFNDKFNFEASVVIPVKNRVNTIEDSIKSALSQKAKFSFNVIIVDNHSNDGTTEKIKNIFT